LIDPDKNVEEAKNNELHEIELKCLALGKIPDEIFRGNDNQYVSVEKATEIMRLVEKRGEEIHQMARSFREKYEFSKA
jgi:hypothetical protein